MTLGATFYVVGVTLISVVFPALFVRAWTWDQARRAVAAKSHRGTHCAGAPSAA